MSLRLLFLSTLLGLFAFADTLTLRDGRVINGSFLSGDSRNLRITVGDKVETYRIDDVKSLTFGSEEAAAPVPAAKSENRVMRPERKYDAAAPVAAAATKEIPAGTTLTIRMVDDVDSERDTLGQTFRASLDEPVIVNGDTILARGSDVSMKLVDDKQSGKIEGKTILTLDLVSLVANGKTIEIDTQEITQESSSRTSKSTKVIGGGAALGAIIGAIAGGGKGAAIGAVSGAGAGTAVQVLTKGQRVKIPSETRLTFTLQQPVKL